MTQIKDIVWRILIAQKIHEIYCEKTNSARCARRAHDLFGKYLCSVDYNTFYRYLRTEVSDMYMLPPWVVVGLNCIVLAHMKYPIPLTEDEAEEFLEEIAGAL